MTRRAGGAGTCAGAAVSRRDAQLFAQRAFHLFADVLVFLEEDTRVFAALAHAFAAETDPRAGLLEDTLVHTQVNEIAFARNAFAVENVEFGFAERRSYLVLYDFAAGARADYTIAFFDGLDATNIETDRRIELERAPTGSGFGVAEHDADFLADLVDEDQARARFRHDAGEFA